MIAAPWGPVVPVRVALYQAACSNVVVGDGVSALCVSGQCHSVCGVFPNAASSGVFSCAGPSGQIGKRSASRRRTGRAWRPCASGSGASAHLNERNASRSCPTCICTASHLQDREEKKSRDESKLWKIEWNSAEVLAWSPAFYDKEQMYS